MAPNFLAAAASLIIFVFVFDLLRRGVLKEKYAVLWLFIAGVSLFFAVFPQVLDWVGLKLGIAQPVNLLFFMSSLVLVLVSVQLSYELSRNEARTRRLAEEVALLRQQVERDQRGD
jgi:hypothetical protein